MKKTINNLTLYFDPSLPGDGVWVSQPAAAPTSCALADLPQHLEALGQHSVSAIIPGEQVLSQRVELPSRASLKALPYLLEETLASPVEALHIIHGPVENENTTTATVHRDVLDHYLGKLSEVGITAKTVIADYQLLPADNRAPVLCPIGDRTLVRHPDGTGCTLQTEQLPLLLPQLQKQYGETAKERALSLQQLLENAGASRSLNLLQGAYQPQSGYRRQRWQRLAACSAAAALVLTIGYFLLAGWHFQQQADALHAQTEAAFRDIFPNAKNANNIRRRMEGQLKNSASGAANSHFLQLVALSAPLLKQPHQVRHIRFDQKQGELQLEVQSDSNESIGRLRQALEGANLTASILSTNKNDAGVLARIRISEG